MRITGTAVYVWTLSALCGTALGIITFNYLRTSVRSDLPSALAKPDAASRDTTKPPQVNTPTLEIPIKETPSPQVSKPAPETAAIDSPNPPATKTPAPEPAAIDRPNPQAPAPEPTKIDTPNPQAPTPEPATVEKKEVPSRSQNETDKRGKRASFRGINLGMTRSEIEGSLPEEFMLHDPRRTQQHQKTSPENSLTSPRVTIILRKNPHSKATYAFRREGSVAFDSNQIANRLELRSSFLGITKRMRWSEFREWLDEKYDITWNEEKAITRQPIGDGGNPLFGNGGYKETRRRLGTLESGERIEAIYEKYVSDAQGTVESFKVQITPPFPRLR
jgi:outer membrane biosynthesis protein TonB